MRSLRCVLTVSEAVKRLPVVPVRCHSAICGTEPKTPQPNNFHYSCIPQPSSAQSRLHCNLFVTLTITTTCRQTCNYPRAKKSRSRLSKPISRRRSTKRSILIPQITRRLSGSSFGSVKDDIEGAADLLKELGDFVQTSYGFDVRYSVIGDHETLNPAMEMAGILNDLGKECGTQGSLIIVYYSGHGRVSTAPNGREKRLEVAYFVPSFPTLTGAN
jgi:hypothetical protein